MSREYAHVKCEAPFRLGWELDGVYKTELIGRTRCTAEFPEGLKVETWRQILNRQETERGLIVHVVHVSTSVHRSGQNNLALCFWAHEDRMRFLVLESEHSQHFIPSKRTYDFELLAKKWWTNGVAPVLAQQIDSIITS